MKITIIAILWLLIFKQIVFSQYEANVKWMGNGGYYKTGTDAQISPDGTKYAISDVGMVNISSSIDGSLICCINRDSEKIIEIKNLVFLPDNKRIIISGENTVELWNYESLVKEQLSLSNHSKTFLPSIVSVIKKSNILVCSGHWSDSQESDQLITLWDIDNDSLISTIPESFLGLHIQSLHPSFDGSYLYIIYNGVDQRLPDLYDLQKQKFLYNVPNLSEPDFSADGRFLAGYTDSYYLRIYNMNDFNDYQEYKSNEILYNTPFSSSGSKIIVWAGGNNYNVINLITKTIEKTITSKFVLPDKLFFTSKDENVLLVNYKQYIQVEKINISNNINRLLNIGCGNVFDIKFSNDGKNLFAYYDNSQLSVFETETGDILETIIEPFNYPFSYYGFITTSNDNSLVAVCDGYNNGSYVYDIANNKGKVYFEDMIINNITFSRDSKYIIASDEDGNLIATQLKTSELVNKYDYKNDCRYVFSRDNNNSVYALAADSENKATLIEWDFINNNVINTTPLNIINNVSSSRISLSNDKNLLSNGQFIYNIDDNYITQLFSMEGISDSYLFPDGAKIGILNSFASPGSSTLEIQDLTSNEVLMTFDYFDYFKYSASMDEYRIRQTCIAVSPNGKYIATGASDGKIILWDIDSINSIKSLEENYDTMVKLYPHPVKRFSTLNYCISKPCNVKITILDNLGASIRVLQNGFKEADNHKITFDVDALATGIYYISILCGEYRITKPFLVIK